MQNPEEEDKLKRLLQDTFSDYEPEPSEQSWEYINASIRPNEAVNTKPTKRVVLAIIALLLLLSTAVFLTLKTSKEAFDFSSSTPNANVLKEVRTKETINKKALVTKIEKGHIFHKIPTNNQTNHFEEKIETKNRNVAHKKLLVNRSAKSIVSVEKKANEKYLLPQLPIPTKQHIQTDLADELVAQWPIRRADMSQIAIENMAILTSKKMLFAKNHFVLPTIPTITLKKTIKPVIKSTYLSMGITPLQTYRILKIDNPEVLSLQRSNLFDPERNGFAFDIGITKDINTTWSFRGNLSYVRMRQWVEYQISTDKILVKNIAQNNALEQVGQRKIESENLEMIGIEANVQRFLSISERNRYFIAAGSQLMYNPANRQINTFLNISGGIRHTISPNCFLTVEPTASYLLNNINRSTSFIQANAYNLGLKIGLNFKIQ
jgi:hypothetical protein